MDLEFCLFTVVNILGANTQHALNVTNNTIYMIWFQVGHQWSHTPQHEMCGDNSQDTWYFVKTKKACIQLGLAMIIEFKSLIEVWMNSILLGCNVTMVMGETKGFGAMYGCWAYYILPNEQGQKICKYKSIGVSLATSSPLQWKVIGWSFLFHIDKF